MHFKKELLCCGGLQVQALVVELVGTVGIWPKTAALLVLQVRRMLLLLLSHNESSILFTTFSESLLCAPIESSGESISASQPAH